MLRSSKLAAALFLTLLPLACAKDEKTKRKDFAEQNRGECTVNDSDLSDHQDLKFSCSGDAERKTLISTLESSCATLRTLKVKTISVSTFWYAQPLAGTADYADCKFVEQNH
jgi:hypothetical protein